MLLAMVFGTKSRLTNPEGLNKSALKSITADLKPLDKVQKKLLDRTVRYVVDGDDAEVLLDLAGSDQAAHELKLTTSDYNYYSKHHKRIAAGAQARVAYFKELAGLPGVVFVRLSEVYAACQKGRGLALTPQLGVSSNWPEWLTAGVTEVLHSRGSSAYRNHLTEDDGDPFRFPISWLEEALAAAGAAPELCLATVLASNQYQAFPVGVIGIHVDPLEMFTGWKEYAQRHETAIRETIEHNKADTKIQAIQLLRRFGYDFTPIVDLLVTLATGTAKTVREVATSVLAKYANGAKPLVTSILTKGSASERNEAAALIWRLCGEEVKELLQTHADQEKSSRVVQTIERLIAAPSAEEANEVEVDIDLPPVVVCEMPIPLPESARQGITEFLQEDYKLAMQRYDRSLAAWNDKSTRPRWMSKPTKPKPLGDRELAKLIDYVEGKTDKVQPRQLDGSTYDRLLGEWLAPPDVKLEHVVRLLVAIGRLHIQGRHSEFWYQDQRDLDAYRERSERSFGLREFDAVVASQPKGKQGLVANAYLENGSWRSFCDWEPAGVWPVFYEQLDMLKKYLGPSPNSAATDYRNYDYMWNEKRNNVFRILAMFPQLPPSFIGPLWDLALGESKTLRPLAQDALQTVSGKADKIIVALGDGKQAVRGSAAEWLGKLGNEAAIDPIRKAYRKEKQELVKGQMLVALEALGHDISEFFNRTQLAKDAEKGLKKKLPKGLEWVPLDSLPVLHWEKSRRKVAPDIVKWWVVQSVQHKSPTPGPLLRRYLEMCRSDETRALAKQLLQLWIAADTRALPYDEAAARAKQETDQLWAQYGSGGWFKEHYKTKDNLYKERLQNYSEACLGSAIGQKGILAIVSAAGDADCVKLAEQYVRKWYGQRAAQCKALLEVLSWIDDPMAIQVLLSIASRFRTKSIRKAAEDLVNVLAERQGWTLDQLADRTLPDAGFARETDEDGEPVGHEAVLELDYGPRKFRVTLDDALTPVIAREDGTTVKSLPAAGKNDDEELVKVAKKELSRAKKTLKEVVKRQRERLYEALCTQRSWPADDWQKYLADHPIAGRLCSRVVWVAFDGETDEANLLGSFRLLEDGSLTDENDNEFQLAERTLVRVAHTCNTSPQVGEAWVAHLSDYDVDPLFPQFGRTVYELPEEKSKETDLDDFKGHCLTTFQLRGKATKAGFVRGEAEDGGSFFVYRKSFPSLSLEAVLEFTGSYLPEEDLPAALTTLYFVRTRKDGNAQSYSWRPSKVPLGKVPPVLISECRNDIAQIAAAGTGFDPEWEKKSYF